MDSKIQKLLESELKERDYPDFEAGDTVRVSTREDIGGQMRGRKFEGVCISRDGKGPNQTFKVRKDSFGVGVERIFPLYSPMIQSIEIVRKGKVRRAKLNYLEDRSQKEARIEEERVDLEELNRVPGQEAEQTDDVAEEPVDEASDESEEDPSEPEASDDAEEGEQQEETAEEEPQEEDIEDSEPEAEEDSEDDVEEEAVEEDSNDEESTPEETAEESSEEEQDDVEEDNSAEEQKEEVGESV